MLAMAAASTPAPPLPASGKSMQDFVPAGWHVLSVTEGDIDADTDADIVLALASNDESSRVLVFLLKNKKGYTLSASSSTALLCKTCGGSKDDPFRQPVIDNGDVVVRHEVGGKRAVATAHRFRYQDGNWYLVGKKSDTRVAKGQGATSVDLNLVTGKTTKETIDTSGKKVSDTINFNPKPLSNVTSFNIGQDWWDVNNWGSGS